MQNLHSSTGRASGELSLHHSTWAIETAHYLRQIIISKRRQTYRSVGVDVHHLRSTHLTGPWKL